MGMGTSVRSIMKYGDYDRNISFTLAGGSQWQRVMASRDVAVANRESQGHHVMCRRV